MRAHEGPESCRWIMSGAPVQAIGAVSFVAGATAMATAVPASGLASQLLIGSWRTKFMMGKVILCTCKNYTVDKYMIIDLFCSNSSRPCKKIMKDLKESGKI